VLLCR